MEWVRGWCETHCKLIGFPPNYSLTLLPNINQCACERTYHRVTLGHLEWVCMDDIAKTGSCQKRKTMQELQQYRWLVYADQGGTLASAGGSQRTQEKWGSVVIEEVENPEKKMWGVQCRQDISSVSNLPIDTSFGLQNIPLPLQVKNPTTSMLFLIRISESHLPHSLKTTT